MSARLAILLWTLLISGATSVAAAPENWQVGFGEPGSMLKVRIIAFHWHVLAVGGGILLLVVAILATCLWRFREERHPEPARFARAPLLEFGWTALPVAILGAIAVPSLALLAYESRVPAAGMTVKLTGHQWFWHYDYPDHGDIAFDSIMLPPESLAPEQQRLLEVDNRLVLPVGVDVRLHVVSADVVHSFFVPPLGLQAYAIPGRLNEVWTRIERPGVYYGQCNQICGLDHAFMPIAIEALGAQDFASWLEQARGRFGGPTP
jgi:cytochrome c oxidase subunit II